MVQGSAVRANQSPAHNPPGTMFSVTRGKSYPLPNPHYHRVLLSDLSTPTPWSGLLDLLNGVPGQGEISGALSFYNPGREVSRPDMRTGSSSHNPTAPAGLRRVEAALSPERYDPLMRPGLICGATDLREHSTYPLSHMALRQEEVARGHPGSWCRLWDKKLGWRQLTEREVGRRHRAASWGRACSQICDTTDTGR